MKVPKRLEPLVEEGLVDEVLSQLMSGKEATVYVVRCGTETRCAKVYKDAKQRSFKQAVSYTEGRKVKNSFRVNGLEELPYLVYIFKIADYKTFPGNSRQPEPPIISDIPANTIYICSYLDQKIEQIKPDETTRSKNTDRSWQFFGHAN